MHGLSPVHFLHAVKTISTEVEQRKDAKSMKHYSKEELKLFRNRELSLWNQMVCRAHLKKCTGCRTLLQSLEKDNPLLNTLQESVRVLNELADLRIKNRK